MPLFFIFLILFTLRFFLANVQLNSTSFKNLDGEIKEKECEVHCKTHFGKIVSSPEESIDIAEPGIYKFADLTRGQICRCTFNYGRLKEYITNRLSEKDFYDFLNLACDDGFCAARVWLKDKNLKVEIEYEMEAKKQNSPVTASTLVTPQMSTTNTPDRSPPQTRIQTPSRTPIQSPFQSPSRTPDRFSMQTSKDSGGVDKSKGVAKSSTGTTPNGTILLKYNSKITLNSIPVYSKMSLLDEESSKTFQTKH